MSARRFIFLALGDVLALALVTLIGFASHGEMQLSFLPRMLITFLPLCAAWFLASPWLGLFRPEVASQWRQLWRVPLGVSLTVPLAAVLRAAALGAVVLPLFVLILSATSALGLMLWRGIWARLHLG